MKYKNFGSMVAASSSNASSSQGGGGGGGGTATTSASHPHSQHSTRTATTTHRSSDRKTTSSSSPMVYQQQHHHHNDVMDDELVDVGPTSTRSPVKGILHKLQPVDSDKEDDYNDDDDYNNHRRQHHQYQYGRYQHQRHLQQHDRSHPYEDDYRMAEEREPTHSSRSRNGYEDNMSWNTTHTPNTVTSSSRRSKKLSHVAYVPMTVADNDKSASGSSRASQRHQMTNIDTSASRRRQTDGIQINRGEGHGDPISDNFTEDREVEAITQVVSDTSSTQVAVSREYSPEAAKETTRQLRGDNPPEEDDVDVGSAMESRNLRRQRLAKKYGDNRSVASSAATSMTSVVPNPIPAGATKQLGTIAAKSTGTQPESEQTKPDGEAASPTQTPTGKSMRLARIMRKAKQNQRAITGQINQHSNFGQPQELQQQQQHILQQNDGMNEAVAVASRKAQSESEVEPSTPKVSSQQQPQFQTMLGLSPNRQVSQVQQPHHLSAGLSPHRQQRHQTQTIHHQRNNSDGLVPPSLAAPYALRPGPLPPHGPQQHYPVGNQPYNPYLHHQQMLRHHQHQQQQQLQKRYPSDNHWSFRHYDPSPPTSNQGSPRAHLSMQPPEGHFLGSGNHVRDPNPHSAHQQQQQQQNHYAMTMGIATAEERSAVAGFASPASMHIVSSEWTATAEENQANMLCGPDGPKLKNVHFVRGGNGISNPCEPIGLKCQSLVSNLVQTCAALSGHSYHDDARRSQFEQVAERSISNFAAGFLDNDFSATMSPHWQNYGAYFTSQETDKSTYQSSEEDGEDDHEDDRSEVEEGVANGEEFARDESFTASARRFFQASNDIVGTLPSDFQNLTKGPQGPVAIGDNHENSVVKDVKNLFDTFQRYYEPEEVVYDGEEELQQGPIAFQRPYQHSQFRTHPMPLPPKSGLLGEYHQGNAQFLPQASKPLPSTKVLDEEESMTREKLDVLTGIRRRRRKVFPYNSPSPQNVADTVASSTIQQTSSTGNPAIDLSYDKTKVRIFYRNLNDRIYKDDEMASDKNKEEDQGENGTGIATQDDSVTNESRKNEAVIRKEPVSPKSSTADEQAVEKDEREDSDDDRNDDADGEISFEDAQQSTKSSKDHSQSASNRSRDSFKSESSFQTAHHCASISRHETANQLSDASFEEVGMETFHSTPKIGRENVEEEKDLAPVIEETLKDKTGSTVSLEPTEGNAEEVFTSPSPSDESVENPKVDGVCYSPNIIESSSLNGTFSLPNQSTAKSIDTCNTDDLVSAFLAPADDDLEEDEDGRAPDEGPPTPTSNEPSSGASPSNEQIVTSLNSSSGMSDSMVGSDMNDEEGSGSSPSSPNFFSEAAVSDELCSFDESPMAFHRTTVELNEQETENLAMMEPTISAEESASYEEQTEFPRTPLEVIEEEESNAEELDSVVFMQRTSSAEPLHREPSEDEDIDIFSLQQNTATQDSLLSADELDYNVSENLDVTRGTVQANTGKTSILRKSSTGVATLSKVLKFVFTTAMIYYIGFIFDIWENSEHLIPQGIIETSFGRSPVVAPTSRPIPSSIRDGNSNGDNDMNILNRLVQEALGNPNPSPSDRFPPSIPSVPTRTPKNEWQQELEDTLEQDALLNRVKSVMEHHEQRIYQVNKDDEDSVVITDEELEQEWRALRMSRQTKPETSIDEVEQEEPNQPDDL